MLNYILIKMHINAVLWIKVGEIFVKLFSTLRNFGNPRVSGKPLLNVRNLLHVNGSPLLFVKHTSYEINAWRSTSSLITTKPEDFRKETYWA
jgi:hypothetical protein